MKTTLILILSLILFGCGGGPAANQNNQNPVAAAPTPATAPGAADPTYIFTMLDNTGQQTGLVTVHVTEGSMLPNGIWTRTPLAGVYFGTGTATIGTCATENMEIGPSGRMWSMTNTLATQFALNRNFAPGLTLSAVNITALQGTWTASTLYGGCLNTTDGTWTAVKQ